jgi:ribosome-binding factor A
LREVVAEELRRIDDPRLELVSITNVEVDADLNRAIVSYDSLAGESGDPEILEALGAWRVRLQAAVGRQIHARKTPILQFRPDEVIRSAERIDRLLRGTEVGALDEVRSDDGPGGDAIADETPDPSGSTDGGRGADAGSA